MNSRRLRPPRPPKERARPAAAATEMECTAENVAVFRLNPLVSYPRGTIPPRYSLAFRRLTLCRQ